MAGRRHHTIPKFLLKGFASSVRGKIVNVWLYRNGAATGIELNIDNVSVERDFYGTELDDRITRLENTYAQFIADLRGGAYGQGPSSDKRIPQLVAHLASRTKFLRDSAIDLTVQLANVAGTHVMRPNYLRAELRKSFDKREVARLARAEMKKQGMRAMEIEKKLPLLVPTLMPVMEHIIDTLIEEQAPKYNLAFQDAIQALPDTVRNAFMERLVDNLEWNGRAEAYGRLNWFILQTDQPLILGDTACLFETNGPRRFKPLDDQGDVALHVLLPLAKDRLLVGIPGATPPGINLHELNLAMARCSFTFFVSSRQLADGDEALLQQFGVDASLLSAVEREQLINNFTKD